MSSIEFGNLVEMFERSVKAYGPRPLFGTKKHGQWVWTTYAETGKLVDEFRGGLATLGVKLGDRVCIISNNRVEWAVIAYACMGLGASVVPMYEAQLAKEWGFIANDCGAVLVIDGQEVGRLEPGSTITCQIAPRPVRVVRNDPQKFGGMLRMRLLADHGR